MGGSDKYRFSNTCRKCINRKYLLSLRSRDCLYWQYPSRCQECGEVRNIVADITAFAKMKIRFREIFSFGRK